jgi:EAL domain-containing protein (putative c-di-GMP-specific phosphodiesterase class I)
MPDLLMSLDDVLRRGAVRAVYQPIVELNTRRTVAFEALARGPVDSPFEAPMELLRAAAAEGRTAELDWACRAAALRGALAADLRRPVALFVNVEPSVISAPIPPELVELVDEAGDKLRLVIEITERALRTDPASVLNTVGWIRDRGWEIALDDVGAERESLAFLPFLHPDIVKLDMSLLHQFGNTSLGRVADAVAAERDRRDLVVLAAGVETEEHVDRAQVLGATHAQGWLFGRPAATPLAINGVSALPMRAVEPAIDARTPIERIAEHHSLRIAEKRLLIPTSHQLESRLESDPDPSVLIGTFQRARHFTAATARRFTRYAEHTPFVGAFACDLSTTPAPGVRGARLAPDDPLADHWIVAVMGPHYAAAMVALDQHDDLTPDARRRFQYAVTHRRDIVAPIVEQLMARIVAEDPAR